MFILQVTLAEETIIFFTLLPYQNNYNFYKLLFFKMIRTFISVIFIISIHYKNLKIEVILVVVVEA